MLTLRHTEGDHSIYSYDTTKFPFKQFLEDLYQCPLDNLLSLAKDYVSLGKENLHDYETDLHKQFYTAIKTTPTFKDNYCRFVKAIYETLFPEEDILLYQSFPSIRLQYPNNVAIPPHCDSDDIGKHPFGEKNFLIPITPMKNTTSLFIEKIPHSQDYTSFELNYGDLLYFNGNTCIHYNKTNLENYIRVSFDFRVILSHDYYSYILKSSVTTTNPRDPDKQRKPIIMIAGGYYQICLKETPLSSMTIWYTNTPILQSRPVIDQVDKEAMCRYITTGDPFLTEFNHTLLFEKKLAELTNAKHATMVTSGTTALMTALYALGITSNDAVIVPNYTMVATLNAIKAVGATPIIVDVRPDTYTLDLASIQTLHAHTPNLKAVIHVSLNNYHAQLEELAQYCKTNQLYLIEDAAQSIGQTYKNKHLGTYGDIGCFSFSTPKIITTGQGGALVTNSNHLATQIRYIKNFGRKETGIEEYDAFGLNFKVTDIQAVLGLEQLKKIPQRKLRLREMYDLYYQSLSAYMKPPLDQDWFPWFITIEVDNRDALQLFLKKHNIQTRITYPVLIDPHSTIPYPNGQHISSKGLFLPTHFLLTDPDIAYICQLIKLFMKCNER